MDFQEQIRRSGFLVKTIGDLLVEAGDNENINILNALSKELTSVVEVLDTIVFVDKMMRAQNN